MKNYSFLNKLSGWFVFFIAAYTYLSTLEPTASFWDCGEFIAASYKLEVGHPPGAPFFLLMGRLFSLFAGNNTENVAVFINALSGLASAFTILFLFWTITHLVKKLISGNKEPEFFEKLVIIGSAIVGALAYTFSDTFWFSAVEGEVYASSSLFTAVIFWAILKWENVADEKYANRWLVLIAYLMGLSIGVHLLNLLAIPAIVLVYYFRKYKVSRFGIVAALGISISIVLFIQYGIISKIVKIASMHELLFVNRFNFSFNTGLFVFLVLLLAYIIIGFRATRTDSKKSDLLYLISFGILNITVFGFLGGIILDVILVLLYHINKKYLLKTIFIFYLGIIPGYIFWNIFSGDTSENHSKRLKFNKAYNLFLSCLTVILIGYSSYAQIMIRSAANPPMDQNNPEHLFNLHSYLNREQYGDRPLIYGQYFNARASDGGKGEPVYAPDGEKYKIINHKGKYKYDSKYKTIFPRMYSSQPTHIEAYIRWAKLKESDLFELRRDPSGQAVTDRYGKAVYDHGKPLNKPSFSSNLRFFVRHQLGYMYFRYFMWNFAGRQNDIQGFYKEDITKGNWLTGFKFIDSRRLGNQEKLTDVMKKNKAFNRYYMLPLALGLIGMFFQFRQDQKGFWIVMTLFVLTGIAIVVYLNQYPHQPRERDYAYAGSFYAFAIWIGIAVAGLFQAAKDIRIKSLSVLAIRGLITVAILAIFDVASNQTLTFTWTALVLLILILLLLFLMKLSGIVTQNKKALAITAFMLAIPVPLIMAVRNWDDHDRSGSYFATDMASNYLNSCEKNAILFTNGDNDTFPLWYAQEVEGVRTDVRVINLSYLSADWYIKQMEIRAYDSDPVEMILEKEDYVQGKRDIVYLHDLVNGHVDLKEAMLLLKNDAQLRNSMPNLPKGMYFLPQHQFKLAADSLKVFNNGTIKPEMSDKFLSEIRWKISRNYITKNHLMVLDFLASNNWERPVCYAVTVGSENYLDLGNYFEMHGLSYKIIPANTSNNISYTGGINTTVMYDNMMNKFKWGGIENEKVYLNENTQRMLSNLRHNFSMLATTLIAENKPDSALNVLNKCLTVMPNSRLPFNVFMLGMVDDLYRLNEPDMAKDLAGKIFENSIQTFEYLASLDTDFLNSLEMERSITKHVFNELIRITQANNDQVFNAEIQQRLERFGAALTTVF